MTPDDVARAHAAFSWAVRGDHEAAQRLIENLAVEDLTRVRDAAQALLSMVNTALEAGP